MKLKKRDSNKFWKVLSEKKVFEFKNRFSVSIQKVKLPDGRIINDYHHMEFAESAVIVARTDKSNILFSRQYLHGPDAISFVLPGGKIENNEKPLVAAKRELLEETGYVSNKWKFLGDFVLHINYGCGRVHFYFADDVKKTAPPKSGDLEEMEILQLSEQQIIKALKKGNILCLASISALMLGKVFISKGELC